MTRRTLALLLLLATLAQSESQEADVTLVKEGKPALPLVAGSVAGPVEELRRYLKEISGAELVPAKAGPGGVGLYVGLTSDFPNPLAAESGTGDVGRSWFVTAV